MSDYEKVLVDLKKQYSVLEEQEKDAEEKRLKRGQKMLMLKTAITGIEGLLNPVQDSEQTTVREALYATQEINNETKIKVKSFIYPADKTWEERIKAYMKYKNVPLKISDMYNAFKDYEPDYTTAKLKGALNNTVQTMHKKDKLKIYYPPRKEKGFYYGNPSWFAGEDLQEEHIPNHIIKPTW